ncbi:FMN-linked oxidoreductase [Kalaharituber pfeilii]|nr:FMN-linked oxidoreductase [Kalaharituber pfeilii]
MTKEEQPVLINVAAPGISYFTPAQVPAPGTILAEEGKVVPKVFEPIKIRDLEFQNRIIVSPMCQYSAELPLNTPTLWHIGHFGGIWTRAGPGLTIIEATAVEPRGRISPQDLVLWSDSQIPAYASLVEFAHSQNQKIGIQIAHAGRKAGTVAPWLSGAALAPKEDGGFADDVIGPHGGRESMWDERHAVPKALSTEEVENVVKLFQNTAIMAVKAGFDVIEIHGAHGYLISSFLSPATNHRTDKYGGSFENRIRLLLEVTKAVREVIPAGMPLFVRVNASDLIEHTFPTSEAAEQNSWTVKQTAELAKILATVGVDLLDVSSGGNHPSQKIVSGRQIEFAEFIRREVKKSGANIMVGAVGEITSGRGGADVVFVGRAFQRKPALVWDWADELGVKVQVTNQVGWPVKGRGYKGRAKM